MKHQRILLVTEATAAGLARHVIDLGCGLARAGNDVRVIYSPLRVDGVFRRGLERFSQLGIEVAAVPMRRSPHPSDAVAAAAIRSYIKSHGPFDVIHGHSSKGGALARISGIGLPGARVYTPHAMFTMNPGLNPAAWWMVAGAERILSRVGHGIIVVSDDEYRHARQQIGIDPRRLFLVENGIDLAGVPGASRLREDLGLSDDDLCIGFVGRLSSQKDPENLLRAFALLAPKCPRARLIMVGDGPLARPLQAEAARLGVENRVSWPGALDGPSVMPALDVFALPSRYEGFPYVILESMAAGVPIVTTRVGGAQTLIADGRNGLIVPPGDPTALANALERMLADEEQRRSMGQESALRVRKYSVENMVSKTLEVYEAVRSRSGSAVSPRLGGAPRWGRLRKAARNTVHKTAAVLSVAANALLSDRSQGAFGIFMYHRVVTPTPGVSPPTSNVAPRQFRAQLEGLLARGYQAWPLRRAVERHSNGGAIPEKVFVVTFDDGFESVYTTAWPILQELRVPATVFLSTGYLDSRTRAAHDDWEAAGSDLVPPSAWRPLSRDQCKEMYRQGLVDFGSHGHWHRDFRKEPEEFRRDLRESLNCLREMFGQEKYAFSFPWGFHTPEMIAVAKQEGLLCGLTICRCLIAPGLDPFSWGRFQAEAADSAATLAAKLAGWYTPFRDGYRLPAMRHYFLPS